MELKEAYRILGFDNVDVSNIEVKKAYRNLSKKVHPDKQDGSEYFQMLLNEAKDTILNKDKVENKINDKIMNVLIQFSNEVIQEELKSYTSYSSGKNKFLELCHNKIEAVEEAVDINEKSLRKLEKAKDKFKTTYKKGFAIFIKLDNMIKECSLKIGNNKETLKILKEAEQVIMKNIIAKEIEHKESFNNNSKLSEMYEQSKIDFLNSGANPYRATMTMR